MFMKISTLIMAALVVTMSACAIDPAGQQLRAEDQGDGAGAIEDRSVTSEEASTEEALATGFADDEAGQAVSCSIVQYCNAPGGDGTRCKQQGCSFWAAVYECEAETYNVCGSPVYPWIFVGLDGRRYSLSYL